jgi:hypothetical protein
MIMQEKNSYVQWLARDRTIAYSSSPFWPPSDKEVLICSSSGSSSLTQAPRGNGVNAGMVCQFSGVKDREILSAMPWMRARCTTERSVGYSAASDTARQHSSTYLEYCTG